MKVLKIIITFASFILLADVYGQSNYEWDNLKVGGGGYVTGFLSHPADKDIQYIRTDVGGAYKWDAEEEQWMQLLNWVGPENHNLIGVDGMAIDPNLPDRIYLALGMRIDGDGGVYRSEDGGKTWTRLLTATFEGNGRAARWIGECLAVDPNASDVIYVGTRRQGLLRSTDDGKTWLKVADIPEGYTGTPTTGVRSIVFDPKSKAEGRSSTIYVGIPGTGIFYSTNGGNSFSLIPNSPTDPARMQVVNSELFVTHSTGVAVWSSGEWLDISPVEDRNYVGIAVDELNSNRIVTAQYRSSFNNAIYRSSDKGRTWEQINTEAFPIKQNRSIPWWPSNWFSSATSSLTFGSGNSNELYFTDWFGVWYTPNIWTQSTDWYTRVKGHEETVLLTLVSPPSGALVYSGMADVFGFKHESIDGYPTKRLYPLNECFSIAVCEKYPENIAILGAKTWGGDETKLAISSDFGETWQERPLPEGSTLGRVSISSINPDNMVYVAGNGRVYYSSDRGGRWTVSADAPQKSINLKDIWSKDNPLTADLVNGDFYLLQQGVLYISIDGGAKWTAKNKKPLPAGRDSVGKVIPVPGIQGELWVSLDKNGLWRTTDGGSTFTKIEAFDTANAFTWGAPAPGSNIPTAYCYGFLDGKWGMYRSIDLGKNWVQINDAEHQFPSGVKAIAGDRQTFGRVYVGSGGLGIFYGQPVKQLN